MMDERTMCLMVGLPYSGKSTYAAELAELHKGAIVCPDAIRLALHGTRFIPQAEPMVWAIAETMANALFYAGHRFVIIDATNQTIQRRARWIGVARVIGPTRVVAAILDTSAEDCDIRAQKALDNQIRPIIARMAESYEEVTEAEGIGLRW